MKFLSGFKGVVLRGNKLFLNIVRVLCRCEGELLFKVWHCMILHFVGGLKFPLTFFLLRDKKAPLLFYFIFSYIRLLFM